ncbi:flagellar biosynthetic protein FliO [Paraglaciecola aquimarina]|uniref:Flagellar protein n=1 Tax=Paraglaciecola algarum TaxID=3050085 RepID=A0ABS9DBV6_9ALTE|nr:flagellar biosynthetic protein FliO [Paraglaciecola sp. G1-23]MCF2950209.1 flagellar biosynthetic protein FliO [Paraglaciecola sp. G1-23]
MLLVNWKESKSLGKRLYTQNLYKTWGWITLAACFLLPFSAHAEPESFSNPTSIVSIFLSLLLVIGVVFMLAFVMRRFNVTQSGTSQLKIVTSMMAGTRERVLVIQVGDEQHLLGVTAHNINHLAKLDKTLDSPQANNNDKFKDKLATFMAGKLNPTLDKNTDISHSQTKEQGNSHEK